MVALQAETAWRRAPSPRPAATSRHAAWLAAVLFVLTLGLFARTWNYGFIPLDDADYVAENPIVQRGLSWEGIRWAFTTGHASNWHPVTWLSHMLDVEWSGPGPRGAHVTNVLLHALNAALVFCFWWRATWTLWVSAVVAALFAWHPLRVESVAWIAERKDVLSGFFFLLTLHAWLTSVRHAAAPDADPGARREALASQARSGRARYSLVLCLLLFSLGLMSKPMLVTTPFVLLLLDLWPLRRVDWGDWPRMATLVLEKWPFFALTLASCAVTYAVQAHGGAVRSLEGFSLFERCANAAVAYVRYVGMTFWPVDLAIFYPHPGRWPWPVLLGATAVIAAVIGLLRCLVRREPAVVTGLLWFAGMLVPTIGIVQVGEQSLADRYTYLPSIGLAAAICWPAAHLLARWNVPRWLVAGAVTLLLAAPAGVTLAQLHQWRSGEALFQHALAVTERNYVAHNSLGHVYLTQGRWEAAAAEFERALQFRPGFAEAHNNLGTAWLERGRPDRAAAEFRRAVEALPAYALAHYNLGTLALEQGEPAAAIGYLERAVRLKPDDALAHLNLGNARLQSAHLGEAEQHYRTAMRLDRRGADAASNLGAVLLQKGDVVAAAAALEEALRRQPAHANAHFLLGEIRLREGRRTEAIAHFRRTLAAQPDDVEAARRLEAALSFEPARNHPHGSAR